MWLGGANAVAGSVRGRIASEAKRQSTIVVTKATGDMFTMWTDATAGARAPKRKEKAVVGAARAPTYRMSITRGSRRVSRAAD
jgi:hypothetical protein